MTGLKIDITLARGDFVLRINESLPLIGVTAVFGPSGSGKTSLLRAIAGLERETRGEIALNGTVWQNHARFLAPYKRDLGYVFQDGRLFAHMSVGENLNFTQRLKRGDTPIAFTDVVDALDLSTLLERRPQSLSGGEQQRVAIGRALLRQPKLLLMDEPLSAVDAGRKNEIVAYIEKLRDRFDIPALYVTHNRAEAVRLADRMLLLDDGEVRAHGGIGDVLDRADLLPLTGRAEAGAMLDTVVEAHSNGMTRLAIAGQTLWMPGFEAAIGDRVKLQVPSREVAISVKRPEQISIRNVLACHIERISSDASIYVEIDLSIGGQALRARITRDALESLELTEGQSVFALIKTALFEDRLAL